MLELSLSEKYPVVSCQSTTSADKNVIIQGVSNGLYKLLREEYNVDKKNQMRNHSLNPHN